MTFAPEEFSKVPEISKNSEIAKIEKDGIEEFGNEARSDVNENLAASSAAPEKSAKQPKKNKKVDQLESVKVEKLPQKVPILEPKSEDTKIVKSAIFAKNDENRSDSMSKAERQAGSLTKNQKRIERRKNEKFRKHERIAKELVEDQEQSI